MILVTGGSGYLGSVLVRIVDDHVIVFDKELGQDVRDGAQLAKALKGVKQVVHLAALRDSECNQSPEEARSVNVEGTRMMIECAEKSGIDRVVFASSCSTYGWQEGFLSESSCLKPTSVYGQTKADAEKIVMDSSIPIRIILRFATLFGPSPNMRWDTILNQFIKDALDRGEIKVFEPKAWRPLLHVDDAAQAITAALELPTSSVINVGCGNYHKHEIASMVGYWRPSTKIVWEENTKDRRSYRVDFRKMEQLFGKARRNPEDSIGGMFQ